MSLAITIDAATEKDLDAIVAIELPAESAQLSRDREDPRESRKRNLREELARAWSHLLAARDSDGTLIGYISFWHVVDEVHLLDVAVLPSMRRRGVARALVKHLEAFARGVKASRILLEVRASNSAAIALYESFGFLVFNLRKQYYADGEDALEMEWQLSR